MDNTELDAAAADEPIREIDDANDVNDNDNSSSACSNKTRLPQVQKTGPSGAKGGCRGPTFAVVHRFGSFS